ncbi:MAG TPA: hypothetical protein VKB78_06785 [Pirellulales bacterium]|nr:hypothetical protein [Pirellulales bacterium]
MNWLDLITLFVAAALLALAAAVTLYARQAPAADSPWFWVFVFSTSATVALFIMGTKYGHRQGHIEDEYRFGTRSLHKPTAAAHERAADSFTKRPASDSQSDAALAIDPSEVGPQPATHDLLISLVPLRFLAVGAMIVSWIALQLRRIRAARNQAVAG